MSWSYSDDRDACLELAEFYMLSLGDGGQFLFLFALNMCSCFFEVERKAVCRIQYSPASEDSLPQLAGLSFPLLATLARCPDPRVLMPPRNQPGPEQPTSQT